MHIIAFSNQKGGTGKTTSCVNIAASLVSLGDRVLLIDLDPQGNATVSVGIRPSPEDLTISEFILGQARLEDVMIDSYLADLSIIPSNPDLAHIEVEIVNQQKKQFFLKKVLQESKDIISRFDFILIDCPPSLSILTVNGLCASNYVVVPVLCDYLSLEGLVHLLDTIEEIRKRLNPKLQILGILPNMVDYRLRITEETLSLLHKKFKNKVFKNIIRVSSRLREAPSFGKSIIHYAKNSRAADDFLSIAKEIKRRVK